MSLLLRPAFKAARGLPRLMAVGATRRLAIGTLPVGARALHALRALRPTLQLRAQPQSATPTTTLAGAAGAGAGAASIGARRGGMTVADLSPYGYASGAKVMHLVQAYRQFGHLTADLDPLGRAARPVVPELDPARYGLDMASDEKHVGLKHLLDNENVPDELDTAQLNEWLQRTYCSAIGLDVAHVRNEEERLFLAKRLEGLAPTTANISAAMSPAEKRNIHSLLVQSEVFDKFLGVKFGSFKRYALEGAEAALPALESMFAHASKGGVKEIVLGMPHRGRFNILVSLLDYPSRAFFAKIKGQSHIPKEMDGWDDVASHIACSVVKKFDRTNDLRVTMLHNPSHLEAVNPVSQGKTRAKMDLNADPKGDRTMCIQLHGDAAFAGQGIVPEALMLSQLPAFKVGGTVHMIVNNQVGFTTTKENNRSSVYSSDIVKMIDCPVLHVNGENPEAVIFACRLAVDYRQRFRKDILIDLIAYRRHGHNEVDEPSFTQPLMYKNIRARKTVVDQYTAKLKEQGLLSDASMSKLVKTLQSHLEDELAAMPKWQPSAADHFQGRWKGYGQPKGTDMHQSQQTGVDIDVLQSVGAASVALPTNFNVHQRLVRSHIEPRQRKLAPGAAPAVAGTPEALDWATAEALAFGSLQRDGYSVRITGQDVQRGTFSQRHCVLVDQQTEQLYCPFEHAGFPGTFQAVNSNLSEFGVMCFEYGYNIETPKVLNIWEAQFGDFFNGAQIAIDTFVTNSETKWLRANGLVMLLPHGFDGAGPEHSSSRIERFLQLCDGDSLTGDEVPTNLIVANPTTPANYFHLLRRQMVRQYRRPLMVASPKILLRHPHATSTLAEMGPGTRFRPVLPDTLPVSDMSGVKTIALCSGKVFYDLAQERDATKRHDIALLRIEELSPFPFTALAAEIERIKAATKQPIVRVVWCQEEPQNAGAWSFVSSRLQTVLANTKLSGAEFQFVGRAALPLPAVGSGVMHKLQADRVIKDLFALKY